MEKGSRVGIMLKFGIALTISLGLFMSQGTPESGITETFEIYEISGNEVRGELVQGTGEGIYYHVSDFQKKGIDVKEGQIVSITWTEENYVNEDWNDIQKMEVVK
jgi:hypothetical protein